MKTNESKAMKEIHEIRRKNYEDTKGMSSDEYISHLKEKASKSRLKFPIIKKPNSSKIS